MYVVAFRTEKNTLTNRTAQRKTRRIMERNRIKQKAKYNRVEKWLNVSINKERIEQVQTYCHFDSKITEHGKTTKNTRRVGLRVTDKSFLKRKPLIITEQCGTWHRKTFFFFFFKLYVRSVWHKRMWNLDGKCDSEEKTFEIWRYRKMLEISWCDTITNKER